MAPRGINDASATIGYVNLNITFRTDASLKIGTGHVMRCLALAKGLSEVGATCRFISRDLPGNLAARIRTEGFELVLLPQPNGLAPQAPPPHACLAEVEWLQDAIETRAALDPVPDWMVLDHYSFDARWQEVALPKATQLMVIDDLADRHHRCDLLLDQTLGRTKRDYDELVADGCTLLIGPHFALLRPEFVQRRAQALVNRGERGLRRLLISMGGIDAGDSTSRILAAVSSAQLPEDMRITVIMGKNAPALERVRAQATGMPWSTEVMVDVNDMAAQMEVADLAIGAGGSTTWERCALGLPSIIVQIAGNQEFIRRAMIEAGAALDAGSISDAGFATRLRDALKEAQIRFRALAQRAALICDGDGVARVVSRLAPPAVSFRPATAADALRIWEWREASDLKKYSLSGAVTSLADHHEWFTRALDDSNRIFRILMLGTWPCGYVRLDRCQNRNARVSICLATDVRWKGLSGILLSEAARLGNTLDLVHLVAEIHQENEASLRCFEKAGYIRAPDVGKFRIYKYNLMEVR